MFELIERKHNEPYDINGKIVGELNWNPFVFVNGEKKYFQRDFCWTLEQKQLLIESIYQNIKCGDILVRKRSWEELRAFEKNGETELFFFDIIDGKQRLNCIKEFMNNKFTDSYGNYYGDLSNESQHKFTSHQLISYAEMPENSKDEHVLTQFLKMNFEGVPQSKEHLDYIRTLIK